MAQDNQQTPQPGPNATQPTAPEDKGAAAATDDQIPQAPSTVNAVINQSLQTPLYPQTNVLDQYASYTYVLSWYLITPQQYTDFTKTMRPNTSSWSLLMQSGGANPQQQTAGIVDTAAIASTPPAAGYVPAPGRNKYFSLDYYMDNLVMISKFPGKAVGAPHNVATLEFEVTEPNGITLLENLRAAMQSMYKDPSVTAIQNAYFVMAIRFYGYDAQGNLVMNVGRGSTLNGSASPTDPAAVVVKYIPFVLNEIQFRIANKLVTYKITASCPQYTYAAGTAYGTIRDNVEFVGTTLGDILAGNGTQGVPATDGRDASTKPAPADSSPKYPKSNLGNAVVTGGYSEQTGIDFGQLSG